MWWEARQAGKGCHGLASVWGRKGLRGGWALFLSRQNVAFPMAGHKDTSPQVPWDHNILYFLHLDSSGGQRWHVIALMSDCLGISSAQRRMWDF